jgi:hypothetical protein
MIGLAHVVADAARSVAKTGKSPTAVPALIKAAEVSFLAVHVRSGRCRAPMSLMDFLMNLVLRFARLRRCRFAPVLRKCVMPEGCVSKMLRADVVRDELEERRAPMSFVMSLKVLAMHECVVAVSRWTCPRSCRAPSS